MSSDGIPNERLASWLASASATAGIIICELLAQQKIALKAEMEDKFLNGVSTEIGSFHMANIIRIIMENQRLEGRQNFARVYKDLSYAMGKVAAAHPLYNEESWLTGFVASAITNLERRDFEFTNVLNYFEGNQAEFGITGEEVDYYAKVHGSVEGFKKLPPICLCIIIKVQRIIDHLLLGRIISAEQHSLSVEIVCQGVLKSEDFGFVGLSNAAIRLLQSGAGEKAASDLKSDRLIREDISAFTKN